MRRVAIFHHAFGSTDPQVPTPPEKAKAALRLRLIEEEYREVRLELLQLALQAELPTTPLDERLATLGRLLKELCDLRYVVEGCAEALGMGREFEAAYEEVHRANMSKLGEDGKPIKRPSDGKVLKGPNYKAPDMGQFISLLDEVEAEIGDVHA